MQPELQISIMKQLESNLQIKATKIITPYLQLKNTPVNFSLKVQKTNPFSEKNTNDISTIVLCSR